MNLTHCWIWRLDPFECFLSHGTPGHSGKLGRWIIADNRWHGQLGKFAWQQFSSNGVAHHSAAMRAQMAYTLPVLSAVLGRANNWQPPNHYRYILAINHHELPFIMHQNQFSIPSKWLTIMFLNRISQENSNFSNFYSIFYYNLKKNTHPDLGCPWCAHLPAALKLGWIAATWWWLTGRTMQPFFQPIAVEDFPVMYRKEEPCVMPL